MNIQAAPSPINHSSPTHLRATRSRREIYLLSTLGLNHDPFINPVAELELKIEPEDPPFFSYFVNVPNPNNPETLLLDALNQKQHTFVYTKNGGGKTTLCMNLEALCRSTAGQTMVISHTIGKEGQAIPADALSWKSLSQSLAIDLFIHLSEQFNVIDQQALKENKQALYNFWSLLIPKFDHTLARIIQREQSSHKTGLFWWLPWNRPVVRYTPLTPDMQTFWQEIAQLSSVTQPLEPHIENEQLFLMGLNLAKVFGYQQVYLLIDAKGNEQRHENEVSLYLEALHGLLTLTTPLPLYLKNFLPLSWQEDVATLTEKHKTVLTCETVSAIMDWQDVTLLQTLIANRFRTAGSWIESLDTIASQELAGQLEQQIINSAFGSPRHLLQLISNLIDVHARRAPTERIITLADWQTVQLLT